MIKPIGKFDGFLKLFDVAIWLSFIALFVAASFVTGGYSEAQWLLYSAVYYGWFGFFLLLMLLKGRYVKRSLVSAKWLTILFLISLFWLALPLYMPVNHYLNDLLPSAKLSIYPKPDWFSPSSLWSVNPERTRSLVLSELMMLCVFVATLVLIDSRKRVKQILYIFLLVGVMHALIGIFGVFTNVLFVDVKEIDGHYSAARGLFVNRNHYAAFIVLMLFGSFGFALRNVISNNRNVEIHNVVIIVLSLVALAGIFLSQSRGAAIGLFAGGMCAVFYVLTKGIKISKLTVLFASLLVIVTLSYFGQTLLHRLSADALSLGERTLQWRITLEAILTNPWLGYGGGSYITVFQIFRADVDLREVVFAQSHNHYLHLWLERGLIGLALWLTIIVLIIFQCVGKLKNITSSLIRSVLVAGLIILISALTQSLVDYNLQNLNIRFYFYVMIGVMYSAPYVKHTK